MNGTVLEVNEDNWKLLKSGNAKFEQIDLFSMQLPKVSKKPMKVIEKEVFITSIHGITQEQREIIDKYKRHKDLNRVIHYGGGGVSIELKQNKSFETIYVNRQGKEEFKWSKQLAVMDMDKVIFESKKDEDVGKRVKLGNTISAYYRKELVIGEVVRIYGMGNEILNISFAWKGKKGQTAIGRRAVIDILN